MNIKASTTESRSRIIIQRQASNAKIFLVDKIKIFRIILVILYVTFGGYIFTDLEVTEYEYSLREIGEMQDIVLAEIQNITGTDIKVNKLRDLLEKGASKLISNHGSLPEHNKTLTWTMWIGMYYSFEMVTTIGYGDFTPTSIRGKLITIFYASTGIALCFTVFLRFGNSLVVIFYNLYLYFEFKLKTVFKLTSEPSPQYVQKHKEVSLLFITPLNFVYILLSAATLKIYDNLSYLDCFYFFFITVSTIGFGDIYPERSNQTFCVILTCFGLGLMTTLISHIRKGVQKNIENKLVRHINALKKSLSESILKRSSRVPSTLALPTDSLYMKDELRRRKSRETTTTYSEYEEETYVVDVERCIAM